MSDGYGAPPAAATPPYWQQQGPSGMFQAGKIIILVAAILAVVGALFMVVFGILFGSINAAAGEEAALDWFGPLYIVIGIITGIGSVFGFLGYGRARRGDAHGAFVFGLVAALVPPVQVLMLVGAILCKVSPEAQAQR